MLCESCHRPLPVHEFPGAIPERQAVFVVRDGHRVHLPPCPEPEPMRPNDLTPDGS